jgi:hypothetical protein
MARAVRSKKANRRQAKTTVGHYVILSLRNAVF